MDKLLMQRLLPAVIRSKGSAELTVTGVSMNPTLFEGDRVTVEACGEYKVGDIVVFGYKNEGLLIHRLVNRKDRFFLKGDNAFRLEDVEPGQIIGKAVSVNGRPIEPWREWRTRLSYAVNREFVRLRYSVRETEKTAIYRLYAALISGKEEYTMNYKKTDKMDFILSDETSLAVFDPESGNTYFFDETGIDILNILETPCDLETLLSKLCEIYDATPDDIREDVKEFLGETVTKGVVEAI